MADVRIHRYQVDAAQLDEFLRRRADLIATIREAHPALVETRLVRIGGQTFVDIWRWRSAAEMESALAAAPTIAEVRATMSLTREATAEDGELVDER